jgi:hypothetical protein
MSSASRALILSAALAVLTFADAWAATDQPVSTDGSASATEKLQEVTVMAQREQLAKAVTTFVDKITGPHFEGGLTRWGRPVCPLVSGLPQDEGEFVLERISDIARAAGIPLAGEKCDPNLYILVSKQPQELLRAMGKRNVWFTFGFAAHPSVIDEFISKIGPVRVLYRDFPTAPCLHPPCEVPNVSVPQVGPITMSGDSWSFDAHGPKYSFVWYVFRGFVIVDASQVKGATRGQFADYVALVSLAQLKLSDGLEDAPTILKLFNGTPQAAPDGMTDWDRAFLRALYTTDQHMHGQRWSVVQSMVNEIAH